MDFIKVIAIVGMILVHVYEVWFSSRLQDDPLSMFYQILGGPFAAPVFLFAMGIGIIYTKHDRPIDFFRRGLVIMLTGYVLNVVIFTALFVKTVAPLEQAVMAILQVDILQFAGLSFMLIGLLKCFPVNRWHIFGVALVLNLIAQIIGFSGVKIDVNPAVNCLIGLFIYIPDNRIFFPLLSWFIVIAAGVVVGSYLREFGAERGKVYLVASVIGVVLIAVSTIWAVANNMPLMDYFKDGALFYELAATPWIIGFVFVWTSIAYCLLSLFNTEKLDSMTGYVSRHLTRIYILQWVIIPWGGALLFYMGIRLNDLILVIPIALVILAICLALLPLYDAVTKYIRGRMAETHAEL